MKHHKNISALYKLQKPYMLRSSSLCTCLCGCLLFVCLFVRTFIAYCYGDTSHLTKYNLFRISEISYSVWYSNLKIFPNVLILLRTSEP